MQWTALYDRNYTGIFLNKRADKTNIVAWTQNGTNSSLFNLFGQRSRNSEIQKNLNSNMITYMMVAFALPKTAVSGVSTMIEQEPKGKRLAFISVKKNSFL